MPNNMPVTMSVDSLRRRAEIAAHKSIVNVAFYSAFPEDLKEIENIVEWGARGFKLFLSKQIGGVDPEDDEAILRYFRKVAELSAPVLIHAEDKRFFESKFEDLRRKGRCDAKAFSEAHSIRSEVKAIKRAVELARKSSVHLHVCHVSAGQSMSIIASAKDSGVNVTCEVTPHHLLLSISEVSLLGHIVLTTPPLRSEGDRKALWSSLERGTVDIIVTDHAPHALDEKEKDSVWEVAPGFPGLETMAPLMLTQVNRGCLALSKFVQMTSRRPAEIFGIEKRGILREGCFADFIVVDMKREWKIDSSRFYSKAKFSPFDGKTVKGKVIKTFVNGRLVMDEGEIVGKLGEGRIIR